MNRKLAQLGALGAGAVLLVAACGGSAGQAENDGVLRIAMGSPGEAQIRVWDDVAAQYMAANPDTKVEINYQQDDLYQTIGLPGLLAGRNAPDLYFEWTGERTKQRMKDGYVADITEQFKSGPLAGIWDDKTLGAYTLDDKVVMVPYTADVTTVMWYNVDLLAANNVTPPKTWDELLAACETLNAAGIIPITVGNKDLWPAGNWFGHVASRVVGEDVYSETLSGTGKFSTPEWTQAFEYIKQAADAKCINDSANAIDDNAGAQLFFQGKAAMHPIGSWLVSWAIDEAPELNFDWVNTQAMPEGAKGNQDSVIGVATGYIINAKSAKQTEAAEFMALLNNEENTQKLIEAEVTPLTISASEGAEIDSRSAALSDLLNTAPAIVLPPDTGYDLKTADALYAGIAAVMGGQATPEAALAEIDRVLGREAAPAHRPGPHHDGRPAAAPAALGRPVPRPSGRHPMKPTRSFTPWLFLAPALLVFGFAVLLPMVATFGYSFTEWNGFGPMTFVGLDNYVKVATDPLFRDSFIHVCIYIAATLVLEVAVGLGLAGIISARAGGLWFRVAIFTPVMLPMVVVAILWSFVYNPDFGLVNATLAAVGLEELQRIWLGDTSTALLAVSVVSGWVYAGFYMMIFHAAFRQIPAEAVEAGRLDGAGEWDLFRRIKVPMIRNAVWVGVLLCVTGGFQGFDLFFVLTNGGPYGATEIPTTLLVKTVFRNGEVGYGSAMAVVLTAIVLAVGLVYARLQRRGDRPAVQVTDEDLTQDGAR